jgi:hypothetical protein
MTKPVSRLFLQENELEPIYSKNAFCADCGSPHPDWASINLCIMICINCSGIHRSLGTHISKVRSLQLDKWSKNLLRLLNDVGNQHANEMWESKLIQFSGGEGVGKRNSSQSPDLISKESPREEGYLEVGRSSPEATKKDFHPSSLTLSNKLSIIAEHYPSLSLQNNDQKNIAITNDIREKFIKQKYVEKRYLDDNEPQMTKSEFVAAVKDGRVLTVMKGLIQGIDINFLHSSSSSSSAANDRELFGQTPLMIACRFQQLLIVELLVLWNVNLETINSFGKTAVNVMNDIMKDEQRPNQDANKMKINHQILQLLTTNTLK